ncbi:hypothetical protein [Thiohalophilus thiocyanatoxydans]|uniref:hypothetical protein n=1 Tax=Thiohalophilus thiocyanatoxydans TaxID=381308 RepID=UPI00106666DC|nr:hypothetical protein [Thiohalophilus thiocyanatoxydans]
MFVIKKQTLVNVFNVGRTLFVRRKGSWRGQSHHCGATGSPGDWQLETVLNEGTTEHTKALFRVFAGDFFICFYPNRCFELPTILILTGTTMKAGSQARQHRMREPGNLFKDQTHPSRCPRPHFIQSKDKLLFSTRHESVDNLPAQGHRIHTCQTTGQLQCLAQLNIGIDTHMEIIVL